MLKATFINYVKVLMETRGSHFELFAETSMHNIKIVISGEVYIEQTKKDNSNSNSNSVVTYIYDNAILETLPNDIYKITKLKETRYTTTMEKYSKNVAYMRDNTQLYYTPFRIMKDQVFALFQTASGVIKPMYFVHGRVFYADLVKGEEGEKDKLVLNHSKLRYFFLVNREGSFIQFSSLNNAESIPSLVKKYKNIAKNKGYDFEEINNGIKGGVVNDKFSKRSKA